MAQPYVSLHYHFVWATWDRLPLLTPDVEAVVYASVYARCADLGVVPRALGGIEDHVHLLVGAPAALAPSDIVGPIKGASAHRVNSLGMGDCPFRWQGGYGVFSVSRGDLPRVVAYIRGQRVHHQTGSLDDTLEQATANPNLDAP